MSKLEPTRTYSNPTANDILRRMLDERGVEWQAPTSFDGTARYDTVAGGYWFHEFNGKITIHGLDPEQAIAATLGPAVRHPKPHEQWTTVLLPEIAWSWDDSWPDYLSVAHDTYGEWRTYVPEATLGTGTCEADETDTWECVRDDLGGYGKTMTVHVMKCTECGHVYEHVNGDYEYCPRCGRKREDVSE